MFEEINEFSSDIRSLVLFYFQSMSVQEDDLYLDAVGGSKLNGKFAAAALRFVLCFRRFQRYS